MGTKLIVSLLLSVIIATVVLAAPPLGTGLSSESTVGTTATLPSLSAPSSPTSDVQTPLEPLGYTFYPLDDKGNLGAPVAPEAVFNQGPIIATTPEPLPECPPEAPIRIDATLCINEAALALLNEGNKLTIHPDGTVVFHDPGEFDYLGGGYAFDPLTEHCNPNIKVLLQEAAVAGSQVTRGMVNTQLDYPQTDPLIAVNNPRADGYGGSCTIELITFDIQDILGVDDLLQSLDDIVAIINAIAAFDLDSLFGVACRVFNTILGEVQEQLIATIQSNSPLTPLQQFLRAIGPGFVAPLQSLLDVSTSAQPTTATIPGIVTGSPLVVAHIPDVGYVYMAQLKNGLAMVVHISPTPLVPDDAG